MTDKNVIKTSNFQSKGDWINQIINEHCVVKNVGAVEAVAEEKDDDGNVIVEGVRGKVGKDELDMDALRQLAEANGKQVKSYPNTGMARMNVGNMLRAAARKRHGLNLPAEAGEIATGSTTFTWTGAPADFEVNEKVTENPDGSKYVPETDE